MNFTQKSSLVRSHAVLIMAGLMTMEEVPNFFNLREQVAIFLGLEEVEEKETVVVRNYFN